MIKMYAIAFRGHFSAFYIIHVSISDTFLIDFRKLKVNA